MKLVLKYFFFVIISIIVNIVFQYISFFIYNEELSLYIAMFIGTIAGLIVKYILDKNFIFYYNTNSYKENGLKFLIYSFMGVFTTIIFWGSEIIFDYLWDLKYVGAIIGLIIGYIVKYNLDKKYVFKDIV